MDTATATATFTLTGIGLFLLASCVWRSRQRARACAWFIAAWLLVCAAHTAYGVLIEGHALMEELGAHVAILGFPVLLALALRQRDGGKPAERAR